MLPTLPDCLGVLADAMPDLPLALARRVDYCQLLPGKVLQKWLRGRSATEVLVMFIGADADPAIEAIEYLRHRVGNTFTRLICFASGDAFSRLQLLVCSHDIHRLQSQLDCNDSYLIRLVEAETSVYRLQNVIRGSREREIELMNWLARLSRKSLFEASDQPLLLQLVARFLNADIGILSDGKGRISHLSLGDNLHQPHGFSADEESVRSLWQSVMDELQLPETDPRPLRIELQADHTSHAKAGVLSGRSIHASIYLPFRCYQQRRGGLLLMVASENLAHMEVGQMNLLEKVMDQLRGILERQQAEATLQQQYERLQKTLNSLHQTREQLYHAEKLSSIGQLAAGIAHEINNPVAFVLSNFEPLDDYIHSICELLRRHDEFIQTLDAGGELRSSVDSLRQAHRHCDLDFMLDDINALVAESRSGLQRVCDIVSSLRNFARKDNPEPELVDLVSCYRDSLMILRISLSHQIQLHEDLPERLELYCNPGQMGQVFVNLLQNACQAMPEGGVLGVHIRAEGDRCLIEIRDTGEGIPESVRSKIFDPFFTTKPVGQGTGLGLSTVYSLIQNHKGYIEVESETGLGTCMRITLPLETDRAPVSQP